MNDREKRAVKLWVNNTVDNLEDIIENDNLTEEEINALNLTINVLQRRVDE